MYEKEPYETTGKWWNVKKPADAFWHECNFGYMLITYFFPDKIVPSVKSCVDQFIYCQQDANLGCTRYLKEFYGYRVLSDLSSVPIFPSLYYMVNQKKNSRDRGYIVLLLSVCLCVCQKLNNLNLNIGHNFWVVSDTAFIFYMCIPCGKTFSLYQGQGPLSRWIDIMRALLFQKYSLCVIIF